MLGQMFLTLCMIILQNLTALQVGHFLQLYEIIVLLTKIKIHVSGRSGERMDYFGHRYFL